MGSVIKFLKAHTLQFIALAVLGAAMLSAGKRAALPAIMAVFKFLWPFIVLWIIWRFIKAKVASVAAKFKEQVLEAAAQQGQAPGGFASKRAGGKGGQVLDLCPKCGVLLTAGHKCSK